jgi:uncharacterized protein
VVCKNLRKVSISTGIGTEKVLTDLICKEVIDSIMIPELKKGNYFLSIREAIFELQKRWE